MNTRNIVLCILYLFLVPMGGFAQSEVVVLYPDTENKDLDEAVYQKSFGRHDRYGEKCGLAEGYLRLVPQKRFRRDGISCSILVGIKG